MRDEFEVGSTEIFLHALMLTDLHSCPSKLP